MSKEQLTKFSNFLALSQWENPSGPWKEREKESCCIAGEEMEWEVNGGSRGSGGGGERGSIGAP